jgi:peroxiredoxin
VPDHTAKCASSASYRATNSQIATISTDDHHTLQEFRTSVGAEWTFLSDRDRTIQKHLDIQEYTDCGPYRSTLVLRFGPVPAPLSSARPDNYVNELIVVSLKWTNGFLGVRKPSFRA